MIDTEMDVTDKKVKTFTVKPMTIPEVREFIEHWHYSKNINGITSLYTFGLFCEDKMIGAMIYGTLAMANAWKKYSDLEKNVIELRRLCCIDKTPRNTESYFIGQTLKWLKKNTEHKVIVSYADTFHGHEGTIYKATNFKHCGMTAKGKIILDSDGRTFHDKAIRTYHIDKNGVKKIKPFAERLKARLESGEAKYIETPGKHIYVFNLND